MSLVHVLLDLPDIERLSPHLQKRDVIVDMSLISPSEPLRRAVKEAHPDIPWVSPDMASKRTFEKMRDAYLRETSDLPNRPILDGESLNDLLFHDDGQRRLPLWWFTRMSERRFRLDDLPQHLLRRFWLLQCDGIGAIARQLEGRSIVVWGERTRTTRMLFDLLVKKLRAVDYGHESSTGSKYMLRDSGTLEATAPPFSKAKILFRHAKIAHSGQKVSSRHRTTGRHRAKILVATFASDWHRPGGDGEARHRYFHELAEALHEDGQSIAWLPLGLLPESIPELDEALSNQPLPVDWQAFGAQPSRLLSIVNALGVTRQRFDEVRGAMARHPELTLFGEDVTPWLLEELEHLVDTELFKFLWQKKIVERACVRHDAELLIYRDEFYQLGRATSWAHTPTTRKWAVQHGLITEDHWTYLYTARDHRPPHHIPAPDRFFTYGAYTTKLMTRWGAPLDMFDTIGSLRHDAMIARAAHQEALPVLHRGDFGIPDDRPLCVICTQLTSQVPGWIERLVDALRRAGIHAHVAIKQHHFHRADALIHDTFHKLDWSDYSVHTQHLEELLRMADVALTENSTTGIEALILGTPLICYDEPARYESFPYVTHGGARSGKDVETMSASLKEVLMNSTKGDLEAKRRRFLKRHLANMQRPAIENFLERIEPSW